jgi:hypothetical protein
MAGVAADADVELGAVRSASPMLHAVLALLVLVVATVLAVYKPVGVTPYGQRKQSQTPFTRNRTASRRPS